MEIQRNPSKVTIIFSPDRYWLRKTEDYCGLTKEDAEWNGEYCLTHRIDMSYKGKDDQEGSIIMYLDEAQAQHFRDAGFSEII